LVAVDHGWAGYLLGCCGKVVVGLGVKSYGVISLGHPQKLAKRREKAELERKREREKERERERESENTKHTKGEPVVKP